MSSVKDYIIGSLLGIGLILLGIVGFVVIIALAAGVALPRFIRRGIH